MKKSTIGDFDFSGSNHQIDLDSLLSFFHHGGAHHPSPAPSVQFRSVDGSGNNLSDPTLNQTNTDFARVAPANFSDGISAMTPGPNPREISNILVAQAGTGEDGPHLTDDHGVALSGMMYAWGQFIDHDLDLEKQGTTTDISITVPADDQFLAPGSVIPVTRVAIDPATGVAGHPATAINTIIGWLDGSQIYGSDAATAANLRTADGHMKTSAGDNLPIDPQSGMFMAGDVRAQENPDLTALQTLFVREHNYQGVWRAAAGTVRLDGAPIDRWSSDDLGRYIGYLPQDVSLFDGTVATNIARFDDAATSEAILEAARVFGAHEMILRLPDGYDTRIGDRGISLSAGQRQRIGLTRAVFGRPFLVVLDEPNANLDADGENALVNAIETLRTEQSVVVVISHRPNTLAALNMTMIIYGGRAIAFGPRNEVFARVAQSTLRGGAVPKQGNPGSRMVAGVGPWLIRLRVAMRRNIITPTMWWTCRRTLSFGSSGVFKNFSSRNRSVSDFRGPLTSNRPTALAMGAATKAIRPLSRPTGRSTVFLISSA